MKKLLLLSYALLICTIAFSQTGNNFKNQQKKQTTGNPPGLSFINISKIQNLKSGAINLNNQFSISPNLQLPNTSGSNHVKNLILDSGSPIYFEKESNQLKSSESETPENHFYAFFEAARNTTKLFDPSNELQITQTTTDNLGITHIRSQQYFKGIKVYGAESYLHIGTEKDIFTGRIAGITPELETTPGINAETAINAAIEDLKARTIFKNLSAKEKQFLKYEFPEPSLIIYKNRLAYEISIRPNIVEEWKYYIDANSLEIIYYFNNTNSDGPTTATAYDLNGVLRTINTYLENGTYLLLNASETMYNSTKQEGFIMTLDANHTSTTELNYSMVTSSNNTWNDASSISAHTNAKTAYAYLKNTFNRNSINGQGGDIISLINVADEDGGSMQNAFWNGIAIFYGNGGTYFDPLAGALDVTAHEMGHGVVSNTANLEYYGQSGAINETYADIFGSMVDRDDWLIGEDIVKLPYYPSGALRNMANPHNGGTSINDYYWQPNHFSEVYIGEEDNGGVHINSGIGNYAYYKFATTVSKEKAEQVFYRALTYYLTSKSQFIDFRIAVVQSAKDLYGSNSTEVTAAENAFDAVGIYQDNQIDYVQDYDVNSGQDYLMTYDTDDSNANTLYRSSTTGTDFYAMTTTIMKNKVCVSDNGNGLVFVSDDDKIRSMSTNPDAPDESILSNEAFWDNVTLSRDQSRLAAISTQIDTAIYVYDFNTQQWAKFILYNPTTSHSGGTAGGVLFADAIEFDHSGEYLIYDAFNTLNSLTDDDITYWDIGFIKVWDKVNNRFGDGTISKLYGSLPKNVSIGNPTFSKNSPHIIAFDYMDGSTSEFATFGANLLTGDVDIITTNAKAGYPSFSKNDDKIAFSALNTSSKEVVAVIDLDPNKITGSGSASIIVADAKWPVFYTMGDRSLSLEPVANFTVDIKSGNAPLAVHFVDLSINNPTNWSWSFSGGSPSTSSLQNPTVTFNASGTYTISLTCSNSTGSNSITKTSYITVSTTTAVDDLVTELFSFYPNPTADRIFIHSQKYFRLRIFSSSGALLKDIYNQQEVNLSELPAGLYILKFEIEGKLITSKIIKQ